MIASAAAGDWMMGAVIMGGLIVITLLICNVVREYHAARYGNSARK